MLDNFSYHPRSDSARLQNIMRFLTDVKDKLRDVNAKWWMSKDEEPIRQQLGKLSERRRAGNGTFDEQGDRAIAAFVPAAQQDLITLTLEILGRGDLVEDVATSRRDAFHDAYRRFVYVALGEAQDQALAPLRVQMQVQPVPQPVLETVARLRARAADRLAMIQRTLGPVLQGLQLQTVEMPTPLTPPLHVPDPPVSAHVGSVPRPLPGQIQLASSLPYSMASSSVWRQADAEGLGHSPV
ncbi:hypothetical protein EDB87DRAFT_1643458 [Lactarius vividus]|nr:hypothetical protein EDB87DRAFT_1643458 [Lactarius vividus]